MSRLNEADRVSARDGTPVPIADYAAFGWQLVELRALDKRPVQLKWNTRPICERITKDKNFATRVAAGRSSVGLALAFSGIAALDIDDIEKARPWLLERGIDLDELMAAPDTVRRESGRPNRTLLLFRSPPLVSHKMKDHGVEFLCGTRSGLSLQIVIPPSVNPASKQRYRWVGDWRKAPAMPVALAKLWAEVSPERASPAARMTPGAEKPGIVGAICTAFPFPCEEELPDDMQKKMDAAFIPNGDRWDWRGHDAAEGVKGVELLPDGAVRIHSGTWPGEPVSNVFDVLRLVCFGHLDSTEQLQREIWTRPSYQAICAGLRSHPRVLSALSKQEFDDLGPESEVAASVEGSRFRLIPVDKFSEGPEPEWIIDGVLPRSELAVVYGESGCGKSFFCVDLALAIARGVPWRKAETVRGRVAYVCAESPGGFRSRFKAYARRNEIKLSDLRDWFGVIGNAPNLLEVKDVEELCAELKASGPLSVVVIDTLARATPGANENSGEHMGLALARCKLIHKTTGAIVVLVHHSGKDATKGARGWSGIRAATDTEIEIVRHAPIYQAEISKQRDGEDKIKFPFELNPVVFGLDSKERELSSLVVNHIDAKPQLASAKPPQSANQYVVWTVLHEKGGTSTTEELIGMAAPRLAQDPKTRDQRRNHIQTAINALVKRKVVEINGDTVSFVGGTQRATAAEFESQPDSGIQGKAVSRLHVEENLEIIPAKENLHKHNKYVSGTGVCS